MQFVAQVAPHWAQAVLVAKYAPAAKGGPPALRGIRMWSFLQPTFLWAGLAAAIPLILHLLARRRSVRIRFPTVRFLRLAQHRSSRRIRMENFLLWLLRTLLIALLALGFALPVVRSGRFAALGAARRDVAIVWDVSASMTYESGGRSVWTDGREAVLEILRGLASGDRAAVILAAERAEPLVARPTADLAFVMDLVRRQSPRPTGSSLMPALRAAVQALAESGPREREYYIVTDGQARAWEEFAGTTNVTGGAWDPAPIEQRGTLIVALVGAASPHNAAPVHAQLQPGLLLEGRAGRLSVRVARSRAEDATPVTLEVNGRELARQILPAGAPAAETVFALPPLEPGRHALVVRTPPDGFSADDAFHLLLHVRDRVPVVCVGEESDLLFVRRALQPGGRESGMDVRLVRPAAWDSAALDRALCVLLVNAVPLPGPALVDLERYLRAGGVVAVFPGDRAAPADYANLSWLPAQPRAIEDIRPGQGRRTLRLRAPSDSLFEELRLPAGAVPTLALRRWLVPGPLAPDAETLIAMEGDAPFLLARPLDAGRALLFTVGADRDWSNLPLTPIFLPLLHEIARHGAQRVREPLWAVSAAELPLPTLGGTVPERLSGPDGVTVKVRAVRRGGRDVPLIEEPPWPGIYWTEMEGARRAVLAVNLPPVESDLAPVDPATIPDRLGVRRAQVARGREELARRIEEVRVGRPLGELVLWLALGVGTAEFLLANRVSRRTAARRMRWIVEPSGRVRSAAPG
ncbi:MAG: BatA domain-containing protein [Kiritimatiellae bacterium]|nr:BatA domain-containing protein [Kiritimatiellia bacterium]